MARVCRATTLAKVQIMLARALLAGVTTFLLATPALAAVDLAVSIVQPRPAYLYEYAAYHVGVSNLGNHKAANVEVVIELPATNTPQVEVLGFVTDIDYRCTQVGTELHCSLGTLPPGPERFPFQLALPWSNQVLEVTATVTTTSTEVTLANNTATLAPVLWSYAAQVQPGQHAVDGCLPVWPLVYSSFFECTIASGSPVTGSFDFDGSGNLWISGVPGITGTWSQPTAEQLVYSYDHGGITGEEQFEGWGVSSNCFEGFSSYSISGEAHPRRICF